MLVVDQVREMRRENERLHDTIAQLQATQDEMRLEAEQRLRDTVAELLVGRRETKRRLKRVEQDQQQTRTEIERRLARVEQDHHPRLAVRPPSTNSHVLGLRTYLPWGRGVAWRGGTMILTKDVLSPSCTLTRSRRWMT